MGLCLLPSSEAMAWLELLLELWVLQELLLELSLPPFYLQPLVNNRRNSSLSFLLIILIEDCKINLYTIECICNATYLLW